MKSSLLAIAYLAIALTIATAALGAAGFFDPLPADQETIDENQGGSK